MNLKKEIYGIGWVLLFLIILSGCISKKEYLVKVEEGERLSEELSALKSAYNRQVGENKKLKKEINDLREDGERSEKKINQLEQKNSTLLMEIAQIKEDNKDLEDILRAKSDSLTKNIVDLRSQIAELKRDKNLLEERNQMLQAEVKALERQKSEEILEMKGTYDILIKDMKSEIEKGEITITQLKGKLKVNMLDEILFDSGKTIIKPQGIEVLERVGKILLNVKDKSINVEGHTDNIPIGTELGKRFPTNWELSVARATNVARYLQEKIGIDPTLLSATGYGEYQPIESNETDEGRAKNRRIEIVLVPREITPSSR